MKSKMGDLVSAATKIKTPLALAGLTLVVLYGIYRQVLSLNVFEKIGGSSTFILLQNILDKIFWLALIALILGVACYLIPLILGKKQPLTSNVSLLDASLDPQDSPYIQISDDGRKKIRHKSRQGKEDSDV